MEKKIIRLKNPYFAKSSIFQKLNIDEAVFPYVSVAKSIRAVLDFPKANNVKSINFTPFKLISVQLVNPDLKNANEINNEKVVLVGVERDKYFYIPDEEFELMENDLIYLFGDEEEIKTLCKKLNKKAPQEINKVAIFGADLLGVEIAKALLEKEIEIKIIEKDTDLCKRASEILQDRAMIINSKYIEHTVYEEENIKDADMVISASKKDEDNIIRCLEAKEYNIRKTVAINNNIRFYNLMHSLGITTIRGVKSTAYHSILEKIGSSKLLTEKYFCGGRETVIVRRVNSNLKDRKVKPLKLKESLIFIIRDGKIQKFDKKTLLMEKDIIVAFFRSYLEEKVKSWITNPLKIF